MLQQDHARLAGIELRYVMTHLVASEVATDPLNERQRERFADACAELPPAPRSFANSSGIFLGPGWLPTSRAQGPRCTASTRRPDAPNPMRPAVRLRARVLTVRDVPAGTSVGYNATWTRRGPSRIATAAIGYADGLLRSLSNRGRAFFDGTPVPLVGRVSMDLTTFDVTEAPGVVPGAWLEIIGPDQTPDDLAAAAATNGYEVLTSLGRRFHRIYQVRVNLILDSLAAVGRSVIAACRATGSLTLFAAIGLSHLVRPPFYGRLFARALAGDRLFQPAGGRADRGLHRHGAGVAVLHRLRPLLRRERGRQRRRAVDHARTWVRCWRG